jgi:hypothetical protein
MITTQPSGEYSAHIHITQGARKILKLRIELKPQSGSQRPGTQQQQKASLFPE